MQERALVAAPVLGSIQVTRYVQRKDGEGFVIPSAEKYRLACCHCGLVHDIVIVSEDGKPVGFAAQRNNRATAARRRYGPSHRSP